MYDFTDKVVMVTGSNGNLGKSLIQAFAGAGAKLVLPDRSTGRLATLFPELQNGDHYLADGVDVGQEAAMAELVNETVRRFGKIDILVNAVGGWEGMKLTHETTLDTWDNMMNINGRIIFNICRNVLPAMLERQQGKIINIGARQALVASQKEAVFAASKSALAHLTEVMAAEYKEQGININAVMPSMIDSPQIRQWMPTANPEQFIKPEAVTEVVLFLASSAADSVSGALIPTYAKLV